jgi:hypothetical protein
LFSAFLTSRVFGAPSHYGESYIDIARRWSRQSLNPHANGTISWGERTRVRSSGYRWHDPLPPADITIQNGLVPLGSISEITFFAFVCPLPGISAAFRSAAASYFRERDIKAITEISVDLKGLITNDWSVVSHQVRMYEGVDHQGSRVAVAPANKSVQPRMNDVQSVELSILDSRPLTRSGFDMWVKVDNNLDMIVADVSSEFDDVAHSLVAVFELLAERNRIRIGGID